MDLKGRLVFIAGGGYFGSIAVKSLKEVKARVVVADVNENCRAGKYVDKAISTPTLVSPSDGEAYLVVYDCVNYLIEMFRGGVMPDIIVPAVPGNFIGRFFKSYLESKGFNVNPDFSSISMVLRSNVLSNVILDVNTESCVVVVSYMLKGFKCRTPCIQPETCPVTGRTKKIPMYLLLEQAIDNISYPKIFQSHLINPNIGGIRGEFISAFLDEAISSYRPKIAVGAACKCHGIVNFFKISRQTNNNFK
jgi:hypothetical protein